MNSDHTRRTSAIWFGARDAIPDPPPLPAPRPLQRARDAATRFFGYQSRPASPQSSPEEERYLSRGKSRFASLSATQDATVSHKTGLEIYTIAINEKGTHALLGGKEIFKTVKVEDGTCVEEVNLRSVIRSNPTHASGKARQVYAIDIADVAWAKGDCGDFVAAATSSGKIILYDLGRAGLQAAQLHEHFRQVHKVTFNPHRGSLLLSGSQDGTVRLWDVRDVRQASALQSKRKFPGLSDGVRDVKWSPTDGVDFAFGTDSGWIQRWDMRNLKTAKVRIPAHSESCNAIDWHPDGKHIASASSDKTVRVWDFSTSRRQQKASWEIKTPHRVLNARWRPPCESSSASGGFGARQCTQLVTSYDTDQPELHIWDFRRPALPFRELFPYPSAPTDLLWHSQDLLWTVGREGVFLQSDIQHTNKTIDKRNLQAFALSPLGDISFATQKRQRNHLLLSRGARAIMTSKSSSRSGSPQRDASLARSWADDGLDQSFLSAAPTRADPPRSVNLSRAPSLGTSALGELIFTHTLKLDEALSNRDAVRPRQHVIYGPLPFALDPEIFVFLASNYKIDFTKLEDNEKFLDAFGEYLEFNAACAYHAGLYRTAQTWRIVKGLLIRHLTRRAELKQNRRLDPKAQSKAPPARLTLVEIARSLLGEQNKSPVGSSRVSNITQQLAAPEITADQPSPLPKRFFSDKPTAPATSSAALEQKKEDSVVPPPIPVQDETQTQTPVQHKSKLTMSNLDGLRKLQQSSSTADRNAMVRRWSIQPKEPLNLDPVDADGVKIQSPRLARQGSNESFTFLDGSVNSRDPSFPSSVGSKGSGPLEMVAERPSRPGGKGKEPERDAVESQDFDDRPSVEESGRAAQIDASVVQSSHQGPRTGDEDRDMSAMRDPNRYGTEHARLNVPDIAGPHLHSKTDQRQWDASTQAGPSKTQSNVGLQSKLDDGTPGESKVPPTYFPEDEDEDFEEAKAFTMVEMLRELVKYYASIQDAQTAAHLLVAFIPVLPHTHPLPERETTATVAAYLDCFTTAGYTQAEIEGILEQHFEPLIKAGLQPLQIESILSTYHERLLTRKMWNEAALLRKLSYPMYPAVYEEAMKDNHVRLRCSSCGRPISIGGKKLRCESCSARPVKCPICESENSPYEEGPGLKPTNLMSTCLLCNHSGHASCLRAWYEEGDGGCPTEGCLCDCVPGTWRDEKAKMAAAQRRPKGHGRVKSDELSVRESSAVERTRGLLEKPE